MVHKISLVSLINEFLYSVNGGWTDWPKDWSFCSKNCGGGEKTKTRTCTNPEPANGGSECVGKGTKKRSCNTDVCPGK